MTHGEHRTPTTMRRKFQRRGNVKLIAMTTLIMRETSKMMNAEKTTKSENRRGLVLSLFDFTGNMVQPWAEAGYETLCIDKQRDETDILRWLPPRGEYRIVFAFPPCTDQAVSGARWFRDKGLAGLASAIELVERARDICEWSGAPWMIENPVSVISSYWREPDATFHPSDFTAFELGDNYTKRTCLWYGNGFKMPTPKIADGIGEPDDRIHRAPPSAGRANFRSATPMGFARAVFEANNRA